MRILIALSIFTLSLNSYAQLGTKPVYSLILFSGEVMEGNALTYQSPLLKPAAFLLDNKEYATSEVSFFQNTHGYFSNLAKLHGENAERYALRIKKGNVNLYEEIEIGIYCNESLTVEEEGSSKMQDPMLATGESFGYYNKGNEPVREATYANMKVDLSDHEASMNHLKKYRNYRLLQWTVLSLGTGVVAYEVIRSTGSAVKLSPFMAFGIVLGGSSYFFEAPKSDELWLATDAYNEELPATVSAQQQ
jgi:hypothetical protein